MLVDYLICDGVPFEYLGYRRTDNMSQKSFYYAAGVIRPAYMRGTEFGCELRSNSTFYIQGVFGSFKYSLNRKSLRNFGCGLVPEIVQIGDVKRTLSPVVTGKVYLEGDEFLTSTLSVGNHLAGSWFKVLK